MRVDVRVGAGQLLISEFEPVAPDTTEDGNNVAVTRSGGTFTITDTSQGAVAGGGCTQVPTSSR